MVWRIVKPRVGIITACVLGHEKSGDLESIDCLILIKPHTNQMLAVFVGVE